MSARNVRLDGVYIQLERVKSVFLLRDRKSKSTKSIRSVKASIQRFHIQKLMKKTNTTVMLLTR